MRTKWSKPTQQLNESDQYVPNVYVERPMKKDIYSVDIAWLVLICAIISISGLFLNHWDRMITKEETRAKVTEEYRKAIKLGHVIDLGDRKVRVVALVEK